MLPNRMDLPTLHLTIELTLWAEKGFYCLTHPSERVVESWHHSKRGSLVLTRTLGGAQVPLTLTVITSFPHSSHRFSSTCHSLLMKRYQLEEAWGSGLGKPQHLFSQIDALC